jgi:isopentenyl phosphate kinase
MTNLILLKIGGSVLTYRNNPFIENEKSLRRISREIAKAYRSKKMKLVLIHGAGSFGHFIVNETGIDKGIRNEKDLLAFGVTQRWQNYWNSLVTEELQEEKLPAIPIQASAFARMDSGKIISMDTKIIGEMLDLEMIPVLYGVPAYDKRRGCSILSGDQIISWLGKKMLPKRIIHGTDVDGVYTKDPKVDKKASLIKVIRRKDWNKVRKYLSGSKSTDVTGGMLIKVKELISLARLGITCEILNANRKGYIERALKGEKGLGTIIKP